MASAEFVHLHGHSEYSLLDGGCAIGAMAASAAEAGMPALAVTDHGNLFGAIAHHRACTEAGIRPIFGCEVYVAIGSRHDRTGARGLAHGSNHLILLAKDATGWQNLIQLVSKGYTEGFYYNPRVDKQLLRQHREGLVCMSACVSGEVPHLIQEEGVDQAEAAAREYMEIFGDDYYLEIQRHGIEVEAKVNDGLLHLHRKLGVPLVATNDFHFLRADDHAAHDALVCIQTGKNLSDSDRMCYPSGLYMKSPAEMQELFADLPGAVENTLAIAEKCRVELDLDSGRSLMPGFPIPSEFESSGEYLRHLAQEGLERRYPEVAPEVQQRLDYEMEVITKEGFSGYFLIVQDFVHHARQSGVTVGPGRGSAAGCLVSYCLGITDTDPIRHDLLFERFLNPERIEPPDIDIDFADTGRDKVVRYVVDKYGEENVSQVITFGTMGAKAVVRDVGRVLGMPFGEVDRIAKLIPGELKITLDEAIKREPELKQMAETEGEPGQLIEYSRKLEGLARHASVHACAVIIAPSRLTDYVPLYRAPKDGTVTTQFDGDTCKDVGLLKMDILGLKELSLMDEAVRLIRQREPGFDLDSIPWDDKPTFDLFSSGETVGVFQFESPGMRDYLRQLKPDRIEDVIAMNALYRPGPMQRIPAYIARHQGTEAVDCDHPILEPILAETYGIITYQEQVQRICRDLSGFTLGQADGIRKAMGRKLADVMEKYKQEFADGAVRNGVDRGTAEKIWSDIEVFSGYGFNKSHSASYSEVAYRNAYLKAHHPKEYMAASLTTDRNNTDRLTILLDECRRMEIPVLPPDVDESAVNFVPTGAGIRFGLAAIKNVGAAAAGVDRRRTRGAWSFEGPLRVLRASRPGRRQPARGGEPGRCRRLRQPRRAPGPAPRGPGAGHAQRPVGAGRAPPGPDQSLRRRLGAGDGATAGVAGRARVDRDGAALQREGAARILRLQPSPEPLREGPGLLRHLPAGDRRPAGRGSGACRRPRQPRQPFERPPGEGDGLRHPRGPLGQGGGRVLLRCLRQMPGPGRAGRGGPRRGPPEPPQRCHDGAGRGGRADGPGPGAADALGERRPLVRGGVGPVAGRPAPTVRRAPGEL